MAYVYQLTTMPFCHRAFLSDFLITLVHRPGLSIKHPSAGAWLVANGFFANNSRQVRRYPIINDHFVCNLPAVQWFTD